MPESLGITLCAGPVSCPLHTQTLLFFTCIQCRITFLVYQFVRLKHWTLKQCYQVHTSYSVLGLGCELDESSLVRALKPSKYTLHEGGYPWSIQMVRIDNWICWRILRMEISREETALWMRGCQEYKTDKQPLNNITQSPWEQKTNKRKPNKTC